MVRFSGEKKVTERKMCVLIFSTTSVWNISRFKKKRARYSPIWISVLMESNRYSFPTLMKLEFFSTDFQKIFKYQISLKSSNIKFHENLQIPNFMKIFKCQISWKSSNIKFHENLQISNFVKSSNVRFHEIFK